MNRSLQGFPEPPDRPIANNHVAVSQRVRQALDRFGRESRAAVHNDADRADRILLLVNAYLPLHEAQP